MATGDYDDGEDVARSNVCNCYQTLVGCLDMKLNRDAKTSTTCLWTLGYVGFRHEVSHKTHQLIQIEAHVHGTLR